MMNRRFEFLALMMLIASGCATVPPRPQPHDVSGTIAGANDDLMSAFAAQDAAALAGLYTTDAQLLPPNGDFVTGRDAIQSFWRGVMNSGITSATLTTVEAVGIDSIAWEVGRYRLTGPDTATADQGKYVVIWRLTPEGWRLHRDIWNSSQPTD